MSDNYAENEFVSLVRIPRKWFNLFVVIFLTLIIANTLFELFTNWKWELLGDTILTRTAVLISLIVGWFFIISHIWEVIMLGYAKIFRDKVFAEGKAEGIVERDALWIEWEKNGRDPDKMPSKLYPIEAEKTKKNEKKE